VYHVADDTRLKMGDYFDLAARIYGLAPPPRMERSALATTVSPMQLSFMSESRRLDNRRMKNELRLVLRHTTVEQGLQS
jgi:nucleoside-diphosphate-sugar epimerase